MKRSLVILISSIAILLFGGVLLFALPRPRGAGEISMAKPSDNSTNLTSQIGTSSPPLVAPSTATSSAASMATNFSGTLSYSPDYVIANTTTTINMTVDFNSPQIISSSVNLQSTDAAGNVTGVVGPMLQDLSNPTFYSATFSINSSASSLYYRSSAAYKGSIKRVYSNYVVVVVTSSDTTTWQSYQTKSGYAFLYPTNWMVNEADDGSVSISPPTSATYTDGATALSIEYFPNPSNISINQYFAGQEGPDLYTDTNSISTTTVGSLTASRFSGLSAVPSDDVIVVPVTNGFVVVFSSIPENLLGSFLANFRVQ